MHSIAGMKCPECGNEESFVIAAVVDLTVHKDGQIEPVEDFDFDYTSITECPRCHYTDGAVGFMSV